MLDIEGTPGTQLEISPNTGLGLSISDKMDYTYDSETKDTQRGAWRNAADREARRVESYKVAYQRAGNSCEICGNRAENIHHRRPRGMGGSQDEGGPENLMALCGSGTMGCHGWIESHREEAHEQGWLLGKYEMAERVPVSYRGHWCLLTKAGVVEALSALDTLSQGMARRLDRGRA